MYITESTLLGYMYIAPTTCMFHFCLLKFIKKCSICNEDAPIKRNLIYIHQQTKWIFITNNHEYSSQIIMNIQWIHQNGWKFMSSNHEYSNIECSSQKWIAIQHKYLWIFIHQTNGYSNIVITLPPMCDILHPLCPMRCLLLWSSLHQFKRKNIYNLISSNFCCCRK